MPDTLTERLLIRTMVFDGAMGTELYKRNFFVNTSYENLCLSSPNVIREIHETYRAAGAEVLTTNSFGANFVKLNKFGLGDRVCEINAEAVRLARKTAGHDILVAASVGPVGHLPDGTSYSEDELTGFLRDQMNALLSEEPDFLLFETLGSAEDIRRAQNALAQCIRPDFPHIMSCMVDKHGRIADGLTPSEYAPMILNAEPRPSAFGLNCGIGPEQMLPVIEQLKPLLDLPMVVQPNIGMPKHIDGRMIYMCSPEFFTTYAVRYAALGVRGIGGCCGTTPDDIRDMARSINPLSKMQAHELLLKEQPKAEEKESIPASERSSFAKKLCSGEWICNVEIVPPQGFRLEQTIEKAKICLEAGFDAINVPDGPRASSRISTIVAAHQIQLLAGIEVILHQCCRDKNLIGMQADLLGCAALGINNILFVTGDPPKLGDYPFASGVFDIDSIGMIKIQNRLNHGIDIAGKPIDTVTGAFIGAGADPNAIDLAREIRRTREKINAGAEYIVTQPVFDVEPLLRFMDAVPELGRVPLIAGIWPLASFRNAEFMRNEVPGVVVPDSVMARMGAADTKDAQRAEGISIARESIEAIRDRVSGVQVSAPFGNVNTAIAVIR